MSGCPKTPTRSADGLVLHDAYDSFLPPVDAVGQGTGAEVLDWKSLTTVETRAVFLTTQELQLILMQVRQVIDLQLEILVLAVHRVDITLVVAEVVLAEGFLFSISVGFRMPLLEMREVLIEVAFIVVDQRLHGVEQMFESQAGPVGVRDAFFGGCQVDDVENGSILRSRLESGVDYFVSIVVRTEQRVVTEHGVTNGEVS